jgi:hypothetical protein
LVRVSGGGNAEKWAVTADPTFCEFPIIFSERESGKSKFSRKILFDGVRFPLKALGKRISGGS